MGLLSDKSFIMLIFDLSNALISLKNNSATTLIKIFLGVNSLMFGGGFEVCVKLNWCLIVDTPSVSHKTA